MKIPQEKPKKPKFRLSDHLILAPYMARKLGFEKWSDFLHFFKDVEEGFDAEGRSWIYHRLLSCPSRTISEEKLQQYDENIRRHLGLINTKRMEPISLKYFQYLAVLFTEIYLDALFTSPVHLTNELAEFALTEQMAKRVLGASYSRKDIRKLAYAMATGSGKTLIMHLNLLQFWHYSKGPYSLEFENIILITPSEEMSYQHLTELHASGIRAEIFSGQATPYFSTVERNSVKVLDIYKLKLPEDKRGEGVTFDIAMFGQRNLVLVDEGHKGHKSEERKWKRVRQTLADGGFTFEYSATFSQVIGGFTRRPTQGGGSLLEEYAKAILFDYSYKYFHDDGYGKEFRVLNLKKFPDKHKDTMLLANLLSFYEQIRVYRELGYTAVEFGIERPLWIFVGSKVADETSDVVDVLRFFARFLKDEKGWVEQGIRDILEGRSGLPTPDGKDAFAKGYNERVLPYLRSGAIPVKEVIQGIYADIFGVDPDKAGRTLHVQDLRSAPGELSLKVGSATRCFGLVYIGNKNDLKKALDSLPEAFVEDAVLGGPFFPWIGEDNSPVKVLIGAKKFIEGWNCWRVSSMGLINIGRGEGPQIIQLFGRGVRLHGKGGSLRRSTLSDPDRPQFLPVLETLGVFGIRADYMDEFKAMIEREDVPVLEPVEVPVETLSDFPKGLKIPRLRAGADFVSEVRFSLLDPELVDVKARVNRLPSVDVTDSRPDEGITAVRPQRAPQTMELRHIELLDWDEIYIEALRYRSERGWQNLVFTKEDLKQFMIDNQYELYAADSEVHPSGSFQSVFNLQEIVLCLVRSLMDRRYAVCRDRWEKRHTDFVEVKPEEVRSAVGRGGKYTVWIEETRQSDIEDLKKQVYSGTIYSQPTDRPVPTAWNPAHLFRPLLAMPPGDPEEIVVEPAGLNVGERRFVEDLARYLSAQHRYPGADAAVYLLRNFTRGRGVGFAVGVPFYPDFILWVSGKQYQWIAFVDPKGLIFIGLDHPKLDLHKELRRNPSQWRSVHGVHVDAFTVSATPFDSVRARYGSAPSDTLEEYARDRHILFQELSSGRPNPRYVEQMFEFLLGPGTNQLAS